MDEKGGREVVGAATAEGNKQTDNTRVDPTTAEGITPLYATIMCMS